jgi:plasmid stabilization system protein ParE
VEHYFASLSKRQTMLLLASVVFGGAQDDEAFGFLPEEEAELLKHRSEAFRSIPKEQRIPFLVREMRRMLSMRRRRLATADSEHLAGFLAKEKPVVAEVVLRTLPSLLAHSVQAVLPGFRETQLHKEPKAEVLSIVRWKLEEELQNSSVSAFFQFGDLMGLQARELITICDRMGARVFATALAGLPSGERQSFLEALPPDQRMLAQKACDAVKARHLQASDARRLLELYHAAESPSAALRSAGARRVMRACLAESVDFASKMARRHEGELGRLLSHWFDGEKGKQTQGDGGRADILEQLEFLARRGFLERPLILPKPKEAPKPHAPARARAAPAMGVGSARLAAPSTMKPSRALPEKPPRPMPHPGREGENVTGPASRLKQLPKPQAAEPTAVSSRVRAIRAERSEASPSRRAARPERPAASLKPRPSSAGHSASLPSLKLTDKTTSARTPTQAPDDGSIGKGSVARVSALQPISRRRTIGEAGAVGKDSDKTDHRHKSVGMKPGRKS